MDVYPLNNLYIFVSKREVSSDNFHKCRLHCSAVDMKPEYTDSTDMVPKPQFEF